MSEGTLLTAPAQAASAPVPELAPAPADLPPEQVLGAVRQRQAAALVPTVRAVPGGFRVGAAPRDLVHVVSQPNGRLVCSCEEYQHYQNEPGFTCRHLVAVEQAQRQARLCLGTSGQPAGTPERQELTVVHRYLPSEDPVRITLTKATKGYSWELSVAGRDPATALGLLQDLEQQVRGVFGSTSKE